MLMNGRRRSGSVDVLLASIDAIAVLQPIYAGFGFNPICNLNRSRLVASLPERSASRLFKIVSTLVTVEVEVSLNVTVLLEAHKIVHVNFKMSFDVAGNFSIAFPFFNDNSG